MRMLCYVLFRSKLLWLHIAQAGKNITTEVRKYRVTSIWTMRDTDDRMYIAFFAGRCRTMRIKFPRWIARKYTSIPLVANSRYWQNLSRLTFIGVVHAFYQVKCLEYQESSEIFWKLSLQPQHFCCQFFSL